ncbi:sulfatase-like hydrolase/transferase [Caenimonas terrae]|uniref:Sulfatase-like hydrolase/transferase n=1 Tax=Caenimonas terrae TaxID=696074 RepID=A0ABW0N9S3_9BURK
MLQFLIYFLGLVAIGLAGWVNRTFGDPTIDQILFHLRFSDGAAVEMSTIFLFTFVVEVIAFPLLLAIAAALLHHVVAQVRPQWRKHVLRALPHVALLVGVAALLMQFSVFSYAAAQLEGDRFAQAYVNPAAVRLTDGKPRNLILIYAESMEDTYGEKALFGNDLLAPLRKLGGTSFDSYQEAVGANWTMAAIVATQCGVPLTVYSEYDIKRRDGGRVFLPGATCLGDLLQARGYRNVFMGGAPLSFSGKGTFLRDHGYQEAYGRTQWKEQGVKATELNVWGLYDSALFERARNKLDALHASGQPFNLTLLTLDTHNPRGFLSPSCASRGAKDFEGIVACSSSALADFVTFARAKGYLKDTDVVILGDHLAKPNSAFDKLQQEGQRRIFNLFIAPTRMQPNARELVAFDIFPTVVEMLGTHVDGDRLGLGFSALAGSSDSLGIGRASRSDFASLRGSGVYRALWSPQHLPAAVHTKLAAAIAAK